MNATPPRRGIYTAQGLLAVLFWSTSIAFSRTLTERLGPLTAAAAIHLLAGSLSMLGYVRDPDALRRALRLPKRYLLGAGALFVAYMLALYLAVGLSRDRAQAVEVGVVNYLWPGMTLLFAVPVLKRRARWTLLPGTALAFGGAVVAIAQTGPPTWTGFLERLLENPLPYALALAAATAWGCYSTCCRRWMGSREEHALPLFLLAAGLVLLGLRARYAETSDWSGSTGWILAYMSVLPTLAAYACWDRAMRKGDLVLVASASHATPLLSTLLSCALLGVKLTAGLWVACAMVIAGALVCRFSIGGEPVAPLDPSGSARATAMRNSPAKRAPSTPLR
ncbi:MAG: aromatic amino acid DMT transporter YddG [Planctomycetota bacterium]|nr:aromatic amino acid DMT transporter YddG [Planctomycetota bacterium]